MKKAFILEKLGDNGEWTRHSIYVGSESHVRSSIGVHILNDYEYRLIQAQTMKEFLEAETALLKPPGNKTPMCLITTPSDISLGEVEWPGGWPEDPPWSENSPENWNGGPA